MDKWLGLGLGLGLGPGNTLFLSSLFFFFLFFEHNHTPSGKKTVTGMPVVTTSQVQIIGCRSKAIL